MPSERAARCPLVPRPRLGTHGSASSACRTKTARRGLAGTAFPGGAWERAVITTELDILRHPRLGRVAKHLFWQCQIVSFRVTGPDHAAFRCQKPTFSVTRALAESRSAWPHSSRKREGCKTEGENRESNRESGRPGALRETRLSQSPAKKVTAPGPSTSRNGRRPRPAQEGGRPGRVARQVGSRAARRSVSFEPGVGGATTRARPFPLSA